MVVTNGCGGDETKYEHGYTWTWGLRNKDEDVVIKGWTWLYLPQPNGKVWQP